MGGGGEEGEGGITGDSQVPALDRGTMSSGWGASDHGV